jgi:hypothetical protein
MINQGLPKLQDEMLRMMGKAHQQERKIGQSGDDYIAMIVADHPYNWY